LFFAGKAKQIGVSNFSEWMLETNILPIAKIKPAVNQIELHPYNPQHKLVAYLKKQSIVPVAYSPLGALNAPLLSDDVVVEIAKRNNVEPAQVLIGWHSTTAPLELYPNIY
jgi:glycerol 2-dehydrogenase (NADP+)